MSAVAAKMSSFKRADGSPRRVLYAEDQTSSRIVTTAMLKRMGFEVHAVEDGELALQAAHTAIYDVILLDIEMPNMDGVTAARSIREQVTHCKNTPILAMSAFLADSTEQCVWRDAFDSALPKPANTNELQNALRNAMDLKAQEFLVTPSNQGLFSALATSLSPGALRRLKLTAADEMRSIALTAGAALEARDLELLGKCRHNLKGLALNFEAPEVLGALHNLMSIDQLNQLFLRIRAWEQE
jgi:CheY-like chemotaxis protein